MRKKPRHLQPLALLAIGIIVTSDISAAQWNNEAGMAVAAVYSDNICLSDENKQGQAFATATPNIRLKGEGARANADLVAAVEFNSLSAASLDCPGNRFGNRNSVAPRLRFAGDTVLLDDWAYFDVTAFIDQNKANAFGVGGDDNLDGRGNTNTTYRYSVSPYIARRLSNTANFLLRYTHSEEWNSVSVIGGSTRDRVLLDVGSSPELTRWSLGLAGNYSTVDYDEGRTGPGGVANNELSSVRIRSAYQIDRVWQVNGYVGEEWNDFFSVFPDIDGTFWDVGFLWTPSERVTVAAGTGERFFGSTPRFEVNYRHKRSTLKASYQKSLTYDRELRGTDQFAADIDEFIEQAQPETGEALGTAGTPTTITNSPILNERFSLLYSFEGRRSKISASASHSDQTSTDVGRNAIFTSATISYSQSLARQLSLSSRLNFSRRKGDKDDTSILRRNSDTVSASLGLNRKIGTKTSLALNYEYRQRDSDLGTFDNYTENRLTLTLSHQF